MLSRLLKLAVLSGTLLLVLVMAEAALRASGQFPTEKLHTVSQGDYEAIPGPWEPNQDVLRLEKPALPHYVRTNAMGTRGPGLSEGARPRVLFIGDSFTFGDFVDDEDTLPAQVGQRLQVEVVNGGVGGTTIVDQRVFLERLLELEPALVALMYSENDLDDLLAVPPMHVQFAQNRELKSGALAPIYQVLRDTSLFHLVLRARGALRARQADSQPVDEVAESTESANGEDEWSGRIEPLAERYASEVESMRDALASRGIPLVVSMFPSHHNVPKLGERATVPAVVAALARRGIEAVDFTAALRDSGEPLEALYLLPHDGHASPQGYSIAADVLAPRIAREIALDDQNGPAKTGGAPR